MIIGSVAARYHLDWWREPKDYDAFSPAPGGPGIEHFWHPSFVGVIDPGDRCATLDELYTIKVSHSYWDIAGSWRKHIEDARLLKEAGASLIPDLHSVLYAVWTEKHGAKKLNLDQEAADFFADAVTRKYDHDSIHDSVAYGSEPMYVGALRHGASVAMDMSVVKSWPLDWQLKLYREEVYATALERILIPKDYQASPMAAYSWALKRTITSLTKGWSARFLVENYGSLRRPDCDYLARHLENKDRLIPLKKEDTA